MALRNLAVLFFVFGLASAAHFDTKAFHQKLQKVMVQSKAKMMAQARRLDAHGNGTDANGTADAAPAVTAEAANGTDDHDGHDHDEGEHEGHDHEGGGGMMGCMEACPEIAKMGEYGSDFEKICPVVACVKENMDKGCDELVATMGDMAAMMDCFCSPGVKEMMTAMAAREHDPPAGPCADAPTKPKARRASEEEAAPAPSPSEAGEDHEGHDHEEGGDHEGHDHEEGGDHEGHDHGEEEEVDICNLTGECKALAQAGMEAMNSDVCAAVKEGMMEKDSTDEEKACMADLAGGAAATTTSAPAPTPPEDGAADEAQKLAALPAIGMMMFSLLALVLLRF